MESLIKIPHSVSLIKRRGGSPEKAQRRQLSYSPMIFAINWISPPPSSSPPPPRSSASPVVILLLLSCCSKSIPSPQQSCAFNQSIHSAVHSHFIAITTWISPLLMSVPSTQSCELSLSPCTPLWANIAYYSFIDIHRLICAERWPDTNHPPTTSTIIIMLPIIRFSKWINNKYCRSSALGTHMPNAILRGVLCTAPTKETSHCTLTHCTMMTYILVCLPSISNGRN